MRGCRALDVILVLVLETDVLRVSLRVFGRLRGGWAAKVRNVAGWKGSNMGLSPKYSPWPDGGCCVSVMCSPYGCFATRQESSCSNVLLRSDLIRVRCLCAYSEFTYCGAWYGAPGNGIYDLSGVGGRSVDECEYVEHGAPKARGSPSRRL
jgi:hypothetical protein